MRRMRFQAQELYILAAIAGKEKMYGIPNGFAGTSQREEQTVRQIITAQRLNAIHLLSTMYFPVN